MLPENKCATGKMTRRLIIVVVLINRDGLAIILQSAQHVCWKESSFEPLSGNACVIICDVATVRSRVDHNRRFRN